MLKINMLEPRAKFYLVSSYQGVITAFIRPKGQGWPSVCHIHLWGVSRGRKSFYTVKKVNTVIGYQEN